MTTAAPTPTARTPATRPTTSPRRDRPVEGFGSRPGGEAACGPVPPAGSGKSPATPSVMRPPRSGPVRLAGGPRVVGTPPARLLARRWRVGSVSAASLRSPRSPVAHRRPPRVRGVRGVSEAAASLPDMASPTASKRPDRVPRAAYRCTECGWTTAKWVGRCGECQAWGSVAEEAGPGGAAPRTQSTAPTRSPARPIGEIDVEVARARPTGVHELDRVLGGGLVPGAVVLLAGEPGVGKSTLLLDVAGAGRRAAVAGCCT